MPANTSKKFILIHLRFLYLHPQDGRCNSICDSGRCKYIAREYLWCHFTAFNQHSPIYLKCLHRLELHKKNVIMCMYCVVCISMLWTIKLERNFTREPKRRDSVRQLTCIVYIYIWPPRLSFNLTLTSRRVVYLLLLLL